MPTLNTNLTTNNTATSGSTRGNNLQPTMKTYYDMKMLEEMKPKLVHNQFGQSRPIPKGRGKTIEFRKWVPFGANTTALTEGVVPDGQKLEMTSQTASISQYGGYVAVSDLLDLTAFDPVINDAIEMMADQGALTIDRLCRDVLCAGTNVIYATGSARTAIAAANVLTSVLLRKAVRTLKKNKAPMFNTGGKPHYIAIVGPDTTYDLQNDTDWKDVAKYQDKEKIYRGEIGMLYGVRVIETTEAKIFEAAGAGASGSEADVACTLVLGKDAYGIVDIENSAGVKSIIKPRGSAGTADPLDQLSTVGWKVPAFVCTILMQDRMLRIEHGISA